jgi:hypothetical protein
VQVSVGPPLNVTHTEPSPETVVHGDGPHGYTINTPGPLGRFDISGNIDFARSHARWMRDDAELYYLNVDGARPDGTVDLSHSMGVTYLFRSPAASTGGTQMPGERRWCLVVVSMSAQVTLVQQETSPFACQEVPITPSCSVADIFKRAVADGAPAGTAGNVNLTSHGWSVEIGDFKKIYQDGCK